MKQNRTFVIFYSVNGDVKTEEVSATSQKKASEYANGEFRHKIMEKHNKTADDLHIVRIYETKRFEPGQQVKCHIRKYGGDIVGTVLHSQGYAYSVRPTKNVSAGHWADYAIENGINYVVDPKDMTAINTKGATQ